MAIKAFELFGTIDLQTGKLQAGMKSANQQIKQLEQDTKTSIANANSHLSNFGQGFLSSFNIQRGGGISSLLGNMAGNLVQKGVSTIKDNVEELYTSGLDFAQKVEGWKFAFASIMGDQAKANAHLADLLKFGKESAFATEDVVDAAQQFEAIGFKAKEAIPSVTALGDALAKAGNFSREHFQEVVLAIKEMASKGEVSSRQMDLMLSKNIPAPWEMAARGFTRLGYTKAGGTQYQAEDLRKMGEEHQLNTQAFIRILLDQMEFESKGLLDKMVAAIPKLQAEVLQDTKLNVMASALKGADPNDPMGLLSDPAATSAYAQLLAKQKAQLTLWQSAQAKQLAGGAGMLGAGYYKTITGVDDQIAQFFSTLQGWGDFTGGGPGGNGASWFGTAKSTARVISSFMPGDPMGVANAIKSARNNGATVGQALGQGMEVGLQNLGVADLVKKYMGDNAWNSLVAFWETQSPSKKTMRMGEDVGDGFRIGLEKALSDPRVQAMLDVIGFAEGTDKAHGYRTKVGGGDQGDLSQKNRDVVSLGGGLKSSASGRYQFLNKTWAALASRLQLPDFSEHSQDLAAVELMRESGALGDLQSGDFKSAVAKMRKTWASFPGAGYGQGERSLGSLEKVFNNSLAVGGSPVTSTNPVPVSVVDFGNSVGVRGSMDINGAAASIFGAHASGGRMMSPTDIPAGLVKKSSGRGTAPVGPGWGDFSLGSPDASALSSNQWGNFWNGFQISQAALDSLNALSESAKGSTTALTGLTKASLESEFGDPFKEGKAKKKKKDKLFDSALTREGEAADFQGNLQGFLSGDLIKGKFLKDHLLGDFLMPMLKDLQGRAAHDLSSMITGMLFGTRKGGEGADANSLVGGLFSSLFGKLFGGGGGGGAGSVLAGALGGGGASSGGGNFFSKLLGSLFGGFKASGGDMASGRFYIAGENGPELVSGPGYVHNASRTRQMMGGNQAQRFIFVDDERAAEEHFNASDRVFMHRIRRNQRKMARINRYT